MSVVEAMMKPETYDEHVDRISLIQTHISWVFLTGQYAYKVKKPVDFGFLDFTTLEKRKHFCEQEVLLNRRFSNDMYLGVLPITKGNGEMRVGGQGEAAEYCVKMREMPQEALLSNRLKTGRVNKDMVGEIARVVAEFHSSAQTGGEIDQGGSIETIRFNWNENFEQTRGFTGVTLSRETFDSISDRVSLYLSKSRPLLDRRIREGRIRDCHGDLQSSNIFVTDRTYVFDCIEFNTRFRYSDVAADIAFLVMDFDYHKRQDLSEHFVDRYIAYSSDNEIPMLLPFYECYRAYVRGKVTSFRLNDKGISAGEKDIAKRTAREFFDLSFVYAQQL
jgi:hypothetical protein